MSVCKGERTEGKLQVLNKARELKQYSLHMIKSDKYFPKSTRWIYAYPIAEQIREACTHIRHANATFVSELDDYKYRHIEQVKAHANLDALYDLIDDVYLAGYIKSNQVENWVRLIIDTDNTLKAWMKYDKNKYKNFIG